MVMSRSVFLLLCCFMIVACEPSGESSQAQRKAGVPSIENFLEQKWPNWQRLEERLWMDPFELQQYNTQGLIESEIDYFKNTWLQLDINGDGSLDELGLLQHKTNQKVTLQCFLKGKNDWESKLVKELRKIDACCLTAGVEVIPPGEYFDVKKEQMVQVLNHSVKFREYNKAAYVFHFTNGEFVEFQTVD